MSNDCLPTVEDIAALIPGDSLTQAHHAAKRIVGLYALRRSARASVVAPGGPAAARWSPPATVPTREQVARAWDDAYKQNEHEWACYRIDQSFARNLNRAPEVAQPRELNSTLAAAGAVLALFAPPARGEGTR